MGFYLCVCRAVSHRNVAAAIQAGASTVDEVKQACGVGATCSTCRRAVETALGSHLAADR